MGEDHVREVKQTVPPQQLLVFQVKQGWKPLCQFLGVPELDIPFPRVDNVAGWKDNGGYILDFDSCTSYDASPRSYCQGMGCVSSSRSLSSFHVSSENIQYPDIFQEFGSRAC